MNVMTDTMDFYDTKNLLGLWREINLSNQRDWNTRRLSTAV